MTNPVLQNLSDEVSQATTVMASAATLIRGISARVQAAVEAAIANGATAEELAPITAEVAALDASGNDLALAVQENTPAQP